MELIDSTFAESANDGNDIDIYGNIYKSDCNNNNNESERRYKNGYYYYR